MVTEKEEKLIMQQAKSSPVQQYETAGRWKPLNSDIP